MVIILIALTVIPALGKKQGLPRLHVDRDIKRCSNDAGPTDFPIWANLQNKLTARKNQ